MNIQTKAECDDTIWYLLNSSVCSSNVQHITIHVIMEDLIKMNTKIGFKHKIKVLYKTSHGEINEEGVYLSREELANAIVEGKL